METITSEHLTSVVLKTIEAMGDSPNAQAFETVGQMAKDVIRTAETQVSDALRQPKTPDSAFVAIERMAESVINYAGTQIGEQRNATAQIVANHGLTSRWLQMAITVLFVLCLLASVLVAGNWSGWSSASSKFDSANAQLATVTADKANLIKDTVSLTSDKVTLKQQLLAAQSQACTPIVLDQNTQDFAALQKEIPGGTKLVVFFTRYGKFVFHKYGPDLRTQRIIDYQKPIELSNNQLMVIPGQDGFSSQPVSFS